MISASIEKLSQAQKYIRSLALISTAVYAARARTPLLKARQVCQRAQTASQAKRQTLGLRRATQ